MATIIGGAIGASVGGPIGAQIGSAIGGYIDQNFIFPLLFPQDPVEGPRISELRISQSQEGAALRRALGAEARLGSSVVWLSPLREVPSTEEVGGKGGPGVQQNNYTYYSDVAIAICEGPPDGLGIVEVTNLLANGKVIFEENPEQDVASTQLSAVSEIIYREYNAYDLLTGEPYIEQVLDYYTLTITSPIGGPDLSRFRVGYDVDVAGWTGLSLPNNGTFKCIEAVLDDLGVSYIVLKLGAEGVTDANAAEDEITLFQSPPKFDPDLMTSVTVYKGSDAQLPDSLIEATEGSAPGYRGLAYVVIEGLRLTEFGNRLPEFESIVWATGATDFTGISPETVGGALNKLLAWAKQDASRFADLSALTFDTTAVDDITLRGYVVTGARTLRGQIQPLMLTYDIVAQEENGVITFFPRVDAPTLAINPDDLAAHSDGGNAPRTVQITHRAGQRTGKAVDCVYIDPEKRYQQGSQSARRAGEASSSSISRIEVPCVLTGAEARAVAERMLWTQIANSRRMRIQLPPSYLHVQEGDVLTWTDPDLTAARPWRMAVQSIECGANGMLVLEGAEEAGSTLVWDVPSDLPKGVSTGDRPRLPAEMLLRVIDSAPLRSADVEEPGFYVAISRTSTGQAWPGAVLYESFDDTVFAPEQLVNVEAVQGVAKTVLAGTSYPWHWDRKSTVQVQLPVGFSLSSTTEDGVIAGENIAMLGGEVIGFASAVLSAGNIYTLSTLLRGLRGTERAIDEHLVGDRFIRLDASRIRFVPLDLADLGVLHYLKAASYGANAVNADSIDHLPILGTLRHFAPVNLAAVQSGSDWIATWERRTRAITDVFRYSPTTLPLIGGEPEAYEIEVRNTATGAAVATYTSATPDFTYTAAQQTADFGSTQSSIRLAVFQLQADVGRGWAAEETFS